MQLCNNCENIVNNDVIVCDECLSKAETWDDYLKLGYQD